jgi:hypothetical protein
MTDRWRRIWEHPEGTVDFVDVGPLDVLSFPPGAHPDEESILMFVIAGDGPRAELTDRSMAELEAAGIWPPR